MENPLTQIGVDYTKDKFNKIISENKNIITKYIFSETLKNYYNVDQTFILRKLKFVILPFFNTKKKNIFETTQKQNNITKPELYIPTMSLVSFVLIVCLNLILNGKKLKANEIIEKVSTCLIMTFLEACFCKLCFRIALAISVPLFDLISYCSYKYVGLVFYVLMTIFFGNVFWVTFFFRLFIAFSFCSFTYQTFVHVFETHSRDQSLSLDKRFKKLLIVLFSLAELVFCFILLKMIC